MRKVSIAPSLLGANRSELDLACQECEKAGAEYIHFDFMDGIFVPNCSFSLEEFSLVKKSHNLINDVHIMVADPMSYAKKFIDLGADIITFHIEAVKNKQECFALIDLIKESKVKVGISIKPGTSPEVLDEFLPLIDLVLVMSVEPGKGGQKFMENSLEKVSHYRELIDKNNLSTLIEIDGGINDITGTLAKNSGVDILVAGSYIFKGNVEEKIRSLR